VIGVVRVKEVIMVLDMLGFRRWWRKLWVL